MPKNTDLMLRELRFTKHKGYIQFSHSQGVKHCVLGLLAQHNASILMNLSESAKDCLKTFSGGRSWDSYSNFAFVSPMIGCCKPRGAVNLVSPNESIVQEVRPGSCQMRATAGPYKERKTKAMLQEANSAADCGLWELERRGCFAKAAQLSCR
jgi:hypothetical protein